MPEEYSVYTEQGPIGSILTVQRNILSGVEVYAVVSGEPSA